MDKLDNMLKSRDITLPTKAHLIKAMVFPVVMYECESWPFLWKLSAEELMPLEKNLEGPLESKEIQPVHPKGNRSFIGRTDAEAETPIFWPTDANNWLIRKDPDPGKGWRWEEKGTTEDEMVGWHQWLYGHEFEYDSRVGDGQAVMQSMGCKELDLTEWLYWTDFLVLF